MLNNKRNQRALLLLVLCGAVILLYNFALDPVLNLWNEKQTILERQTRLYNQLTATLEPTFAQRKLNERFPVLKLPQDELKQKILFKREVEELFQKAGVGLSADPQYEGRPVPLAGTSYKMIRLLCSGKGPHDNILKLSDLLYQNPYLAGLDEFKIEVQGPKRENNMPLTVTVVLTTLVKP